MMESKFEIFLLKIFYFFIDRVSMQVVIHNNLDVPLNFEKFVGGTGSMVPREEAKIPDAFSEIARIDSNNTGISRGKS